MVDELNSQLGSVLAPELLGELREPLERIQNDLFDVGADLSKVRSGKTTSGCAWPRSRSTSSSGSATAQAKA